MRVNRSKIIWFFYIIGVPIIVYSFFSLIFGGSPALCFFSIMAGVILPFIVYKIEDSSLYQKSDKKEFSDYKEEKQKQGYSVDKTKSEKQEYMVDKTKSKKKGGGLSSIFSGEETCDTCGTEMEYKEGYDGYYCPECHEYK